MRDIQPSKRQPQKMVKDTRELLPTSVFNHFVGLALKGII